MSLGISYIILGTLFEYLQNHGQLKAEQELGWNRVTISKEIKELTSGITCVDNFLRNII